MNMQNIDNDETGKFLENLGKQASILSKRYLIFIRSNKNKSDLIRRVL